MTLTEAVGENVRALRARRQWSQLDLAARLGIQPKALSRLEQGHRSDIGIGELDDICAAFGVGLVDLLAGADLSRLRLT